MKLLKRSFCLLFYLSAATTAHAAKIVEADVNDPRYFERHAEVIFPWAEVKLVTFEFDTVGDDQTGKQRAKELHNEFRSEIGNIRGAAIVTYVTPQGKNIENYRVQAIEVGKQQQAQLVLWGKVMLDKTDTPLINARLVLLDKPPGVYAKYRHEDVMEESGRPVQTKGIIDAPVNRDRIDFSTMENNIRPLADFLTGLVRYYKGATRQGDEAKRWLSESIEDFESYLQQVSESLDRAAMAQAHLYIARAYIHISTENNDSGLLSQAEEHAKLAAKLNPYDAEIPATQAVIAARQQAAPQVQRNYLANAVLLAPADSTVRLNLAVFDGAHGRVDEAIDQLENVQTILDSHTEKEKSFPRKYAKELLDQWQHLKE